MLLQHYLNFLCSLGIVIGICFVILQYLELTAYLPFVLVELVPVSTFMHALCSADSKVSRSIAPVGVRSLVDVYIAPVGVRSLEILLLSVLGL